MNSSSSTGPEQNPNLGGNIPQFPSVIKIRNQPPDQAVTTPKTMTAKKLISPQDVIPFPKVNLSEERRKNKKFKGSGKAKILTASPSVVDRDRNLVPAGTGPG